MDSKISLENQHQNNISDEVPDLPPLELLNKENVIIKASVKLPLVMESSIKEDNVTHKLADTVEANKEVNKEVDKEENKEMDRIIGLCGFSNIGNTCYMNATLQQFCNMPYIVEIFLHKDSYDIISKCVKTNMIDNISSKQRKKDGLKINERVIIKKSQVTKAINNSITNQLHSIITNVWMIDKTDGVCVIKPRRFKKTISKLRTEFYGYRQNDSSELIELILNNLHEETKIYIDRKSSSIVVLNNTEFSVKYEKYKELLKAGTNLEESERNKIPLALGRVSERADIQIECSKYCMENYKDFITYTSFNFWNNFIKNNGYSIINDLLTGISISRTECNECKNITHVFDTFKILHLPLDRTENMTLKECLKKYSEHEMLTSDNMYKCDNCKKKVLAYRSINIWEPPEILIIVLKRFEIYNNNILKINTIIKFPLHGLKLNDNFLNIRQFSNCEYDLFGVISHSGTRIGKGISMSNESGHYISYCKNPLSGLWYQHNDDMVKGIKTKYVEDMIINKTSYVLFYKRKILY